MSSSLPVSTLLLVSTLLAATVPAQDPTADDPLLGTWQGTLKAMGTELRLVLHVERDGHGGYKGELDSVDQGAMGLPLQSFEFADGKVEFRLKGIPARFEGSLEKGENKRLVGRWHQGPPLPLTFEPATDEPMFHRPQHPVEPFPYRVEEATWGYVPAAGVAESFAAGPVDGEGAITFSGTLTLPEGDGPFPAAVLITGSGPQDRDETLMGHKPFLVIADHLTRHGFAVLRYDERGVGKSTGEFSGATSADFAEDARAAVRYLATRAEIDPDRIGLIGHSEGGIVGPLVATGPDADRIAFVVMLAGPGVPGLDVLRAQTRAIAVEAGAGERDLEAQDRLLEGIQELARSELEGEEREKRITALVDAAWDDLTVTARAALGSREALRAQVERGATPWFRFFLDHDPAAVLRRIRCPVLALNGERDLQVLPDQNLPPIRAALEEGACPDFTVLELEGLNHLFQECESGAPTQYAKIEQTFSPKALEAMSVWLAERFPERK